MVWEDGSRFGFPKTPPRRRNYDGWRMRNRSFVDMAATRGGASASLTLDGAPGAGRGTVNVAFSIFSRCWVSRQRSAGVSMPGTTRTTGSSSSAMRSGGGATEAIRHRRSHPRDERRATRGCWRRAEGVRVSRPRSRLLDPDAAAAAAGRTRGTRTSSTWSRASSRCRSGNCRPRDEVDRHPTDAEYPDSNRDVGAVVVAARRSAGRYACRGARAHDCRRVHRPHRMREPREPAAVPGVGGAGSSPCACRWAPLEHGLCGRS